MKSDMEIERENACLSIDRIAKKLNITENNYEMYGRDKAKLDLSLLNHVKENSKLILVTSINPTPYGEGKTTISIGLNDALNKLGKKSLAVLREPSLGPVFGLKGGATGGGYAQVIPSADINLHFTGDFHAITTCNNLLCAAIDNHIFHGNQLNIDINKIVFNRCIDINDRFLRNIEIGYNDIKLKEQFNITAASEIMAIFCLASDFNDLKKRLGQIIIAYNKENNPVFARDLNCIDSLVILLKDAIKPNLVQSLEHNPIIVHGGPFANIAHGCNSIIATKIGLNLADYVVTEAGFGADLGAEKFLDIKCPISNLKPNVIVVNTTIRSVKYNGDGSLEKGIDVLGIHIDNMKKYLDNIVVCINHFEEDLDSEVEYIKNYCLGKNCDCINTQAYSKGSVGALELANKVIELADNVVEFKPLYNFDMTVIEKINKICKEIYRADNVIYNDIVKSKIEEITKHGFDNLPICIAKTPYSLSDDAKKIGVTKNFDVKIRDIKLNNGAGFIVAYLNDILTLPGMSENANLYNIKIDDELNIHNMK